MISAILKRFAGGHYKKFLKKARPVVAKINELEIEYQSLSDENLKLKTQEFKDRIKGGELLNDLLPEAFAVVKNGARRMSGQPITVCDHEDTWNMVHYDVQLIGGIALHQNKIAEMATGEGKTLVATCPLYLNALTGRNCQLVTVNDYLALRDSEWMGHLFNFLGLTVGCIQNDMDPATRRDMYSRDITYGTSSEFGFDYLRDNGMATNKDDQVQKDYYFCIIDEVDSVLVDEARTPLIISGPMQDDRPMPFRELKPAIRRLFNNQQKFCSHLIRDAKKLLDKEGHDSEDAMIKLYQVKHGMPKNEHLLALMEQGPIRKSIEKFDLELTSDFNKKRAYQIKEALFYIIDEKSHNADLSELGRNTLKPNNADAFVLPDLPSLYMEIDKKLDLSIEERNQEKNKAQELYEKISEEIHCISQLLKAYTLYDRDKEYVVKEGKVMIVDENTGRLMSGRRWSNGLHQAVEAKEGVTIEKETKTYATITIQNYFRLYEVLAGMTGTAETEASEFHDIYKLGVMVIPTNTPCLRVDDNDVVYKTKREKFQAAVDDIKLSHEKGQPILVGSASVEASETLSRMLKKKNVTHSVLNAKYHQQEAEIVSRAGRKGAVTIATNMAGRGTDIKLEEGVAELGGLLVLGTERHESRRTDRQLRGRSARQGDPGHSKFYVSLEDDLMRLFANAGPMAKVLENNFHEGDVLTHPWLNFGIENAQKKVEQQNFSMRKRLLQYDDVLNRQRVVIYGIRNDTIHTDTPKEIIFELIEEELEQQMEAVPDKSYGDSESEELLAFYNWLNMTFPLALEKDEIFNKDREALYDYSLSKIKEAYLIKEKTESPDALKMLESYVIISTIDRHWQDHLTEMEELRRSVGLRGYGQKDPLNEYKSEAFIYFEQMMGVIRSEICSGIFRSATRLESFQNMLEILNDKSVEQGPDNQSLLSSMSAQGPAAQEAEEGEVTLPNISIRREGKKVGRNDPCSCGSGKKYKKCCANDE